MPFDYTYLLPWVPEVFCLANDAATGKPRKKSLWHPGYFIIRPACKLSAYSLEIFLKNRLKLCCQIGFLFVLLCPKLSPVHGIFYISYCLLSFSNYCLLSSLIPTFLFIPGYKAQTTPGPPLSHTLRKRNNCHVCWRDRIFKFPIRINKRKIQGALSIQPKIPEIPVQNQMERRFSQNSFRKFWSTSRGCLFSRKFGNSGNFLCHWIFHFAGCSVPVSPAVISE